MKYNVALHLFYEDTKAPGHGHGYTDSARYTVEAASREEAIVLACFEQFALPSGYRIGNASPSVVEVQPEESVSR